MPSERTANGSVTITLRSEDAEPILRQATQDAALYGAWCDYINERTSVPGSADGPLPSMTGFYGERITPDPRRDWKQKFLAAKRLVEAFGVEYEPTSEAETIFTDFQSKVLKSHIVNAPFGRFRSIDESEPDYKKPYPVYRGSIHIEACRQAADRVVRRWRERGE